MNMRYSCSGNLRIEPKPSAVGECQICGNQVKAYCGKINIWHWRHKKLPDCDSFYEPMSEWHKNWQNEFPEDWREVVLVRNNEKHFADIFTTKGLTIEFQHSSISPDKIIERELFYNNMIWVIDAINFKKNIKITDLYDEHITKLKQKFSKKLLIKNISEQIDSEISSIERELLTLNGQIIRWPRIVKSKKESLINHIKILENLDEYLLCEAFPVWLKNGRILYAYGEILKMNEVEIRQQILDLQLQGNSIVEQLKIPDTEVDQENIHKNKSLQEIYKTVKSYFLEGLPDLIEKEESEIQKFEFDLPKINEEIISNNLAVEQIKKNKVSRISNLLAEKNLEYKKEMQKIKEEYDNIFSYEWKHERRSWKSASKPIFLDFNDEYLFEIKSSNILKRISKTDFVIHFSRNINSYN